MSQRDPSTHISSADSLVYLYMQIGKTIKNIRTSKNISQKELAFKLGVTPVYLSMVENNAKTPSLNLLERIAKTLEIPVAILFSDFAFN